VFCALCNLIALALALAFALALASPARANDSEAQIGLDGIVVLKQSRAIVMESEDLFISEGLVRVAYRMRNPTK
jgi:ABC-type nitrate/sulfonate/bicarbonate transport system substrate-binding protein